MGLFSKKEKNNGIDENSLPVNVTFSDGSTILAMDPVDTGVKIKHSDGRRYGLMMFDVSNYAKEGETVYFNPFNKVVVEKALNPDGTCSPLTRDEVTSYAVEYVRQLITGNTDPNKICQYIGRLDERTGDMIISQTVKNDVNTRLEESVRNEIKARNEQRRIEAEAREAQQREEFLKRAQEESREYYAREAQVRQERLRTERFDMVRRDKNADNKTIEDYNGVDIATGDVLRVRNLCKQGRDNSNIYLYTAGVSTTHNEDDVEMLNDFGKEIAFTTPIKIDQLLTTQQGKRKVLELFARANQVASRDSGIKFVGNLDMNGTIYSTSLADCSDGIQDKYNQLNQDLLARQAKARQRYADAQAKNQRGRDEGR